MVQNGRDHDASDAQPRIRPFSPDWDPFRETAMGRYLLEREQSFLARTLADAASPFRLLDIGSGTGRVTEPLRHLPGLVVTGLDADFDSLVAFEGRTGRHPAVVADAADLPFAAGSMDGVVAIQCFRYLEPIRFLSECHRVLKPGGSLIMQAVNRLGYKRTMRRVIKRSSTPAGSYVFTPGEVLGLLRQQRFTVEEVAGYNWPPFKPRFSPRSDSALVGYAARIEHGLRLDRLHRLSPWILVAARKASIAAA